MKKSVGILIFDDAEVLDFAGPFEVFSVASEVHNFELFEVFTVAQSAEAIRAVNGLSVNPTYHFGNCPPIDILIIAGGDGSKALIKEQAVLDWLEIRIAAAALALTICSGARAFAKLGLLDGKPFCTHQSVYGAVMEIAPTAIPQKQKRFVQSAEKLFTAGGISAGIDLSFHIVELLHGRAVVERTANYMEYRLMETER